MARSIEEQLSGADPEPWIPEEAGDSIFGEIESIVTRDGDYGEYPMVTLLTSDDDAFNVAIWGTVLQNKFGELSPAVGDKIGFKYLGEKATKSGSATYKDWRVVLDRRRRTVDTIVSAPARPFEVVGSTFADAAEDI